MGQLVMIIGKSGSGKSTSLQNFEAGKVGVLSISGKMLPIPPDKPGSKIKPVLRPSYKQCKDVLKRNNLNAYVIDDSTYLMQLDNFSKAKEKGYDKFTEMALAFEQLLEAAMNTNNNTIVYFLHHPQFSDDNSTKPQTVGKMLDNQLCIEGLFPIVIECMVNEDGHRFITKNNGQNIAKAPMGMLPEEMDNDLAEVDKLIREYWNMEPLKEMEVTNDTETN